MSEGKTSCTLSHSHSHLSPLLSRSCRTECAVWHSYTSQTPLLWALWWTRCPRAGRPGSPKQTDVNLWLSSRCLKELKSLLLGFLWSIQTHTAETVTHRAGVDCWQQLKSDRGRGHDPDDVIPCLTYSEDRDSFTSLVRDFIIIKAHTVNTEFSRFAHTFYLISVLHLRRLLHLTSSQPGGGGRQKLHLDCWAKNIHSNKSPSTPLVLF